MPTRRSLRLLGKSGKSAAFRKESGKAEEASFTQPEVVWLLNKNTGTPLVKQRYRTSAPALWY